MSLQFTRSSSLRFSPPVDIAGVLPERALAFTFYLGTCSYSEGCDTSGNLVRSGRNQLEIIGNQLEIWLEIRNQDPVEIRKSARNRKKN